MPADASETPLETAVLALLATARPAPVKGTTRLQKMAFLLAHLPGSPELREEMDFEALHFGPFSEVLNDTVKMMVEAELVEIRPGKPRAYSLTEEGFGAADAARLRSPTVFTEGEPCGRYSKMSHRTI